MRQATRLRASRRDGEVEKWEIGGYGRRRPEEKERDQSSQGLQRTGQRSFYNKSASIFDGITSSTSAQQRERHR